MNATKILWGQVLTVSAVVLAFLWGATEWVAWRLAFQPQLGHPWFNILGWPVYDPLAFFRWRFAYDAYARPIFVEGAYIVSVRRAPPCGRDGAFDLKGACMSAAKIRDSRPD